MTRLLFVTQTVNRDDPFLGFVHRWLTAFAPKFAQIDVICLSEGAHALPANVHVHTLGKEKGGGRLMYIVRFYRHLFRLHGRYDAVFVHMNPEYVALAGDYWRVSGKRLALWYNHTVGSFWLRLAAFIVSKLFYTSPYAFPARYPHARRMPAGIDTELFTPDASAARDRNAFYFQGRVAPAKKIGDMLAALRALRAKGHQARMDVAGPQDAAYVAELQRDYADLLETGAVRFLGPQRYEETPALFRVYGAQVNLTTAGNYDKSVLEAMACGTPSIVASDAFAGVVPNELVGKDHDALVAVMEYLIMMPQDEYDALSRRGAEAVSGESLAKLADTLVRELQ